MSNSSTHYSSRRSHAAHLFFYDAAAQSFFYDAACRVFFIPAAAALVYTVQYINKFEFEFHIQIWWSCCSRSTRISIHLRTPFRAFSARCRAASEFDGINLQRPIPQIAAGKKLAVGRRCRIHGWYNAF